MNLDTLKAKLADPTQTLFSVTRAELEGMMGEVERLRADSRLATWMCAVAQATSLHMDGTCQWRIPTHMLPRAKSLYDSVNIAIERAKETPCPT